MKQYTAGEFMEGGRTFHIFKADTQDEKCASDEPHTHDFIEIVYLLFGRMQHRMGDTLYDTEAGDLLFMNRGCTHAFEAKAGAVYVNILFSPELLGDEIMTPENAFAVLALTAFDELRGEGESGRLRFFGAERNEIETIVLAMLREYREKLTSWKTVVGNYLSTLVVKMLRKSAIGMANAESERVWRELAAYIDSHLGEHLSLSELAERSFYNPSYFSRIFKEKFGVSFLEYVTRKRLSSATSLLAEGELSIEEIASLVGFSDRSSMHRAFVRHLGQTPADFRKGKKATI